MLMSATHICTKSLFHSRIRIPSTQPWPSVHHQLHHHLSSFIASHRSMIIYHAIEWHSHYARSIMLPPHPIRPAQQFVRFSFDFIGISLAFIISWPLFHLSFLFVSGHCLFHSVYRHQFILVFFLCAIIRQMYRFIVFFSFLCLYFLLFDSAGARKRIRITNAKDRWKSIIQWNRLNIYQTKCNRSKSI